MNCIDTTTQQFQELKTLSGLSDYELRTQVYKYMLKYNTYPELRDLDGVDSTKAVVKLLGLKKTKIGYDGDLTEFANRYGDPVQYINNKYTDILMEKHDGIFTPYYTITKRATTHRDLPVKPSVRIQKPQGKRNYIPNPPIPYTTHKGRYIYYNRGQYMVTDQRLSSYNQFNKLEKYDTIQKIFDKYKHITIPFLDFQLAQFFNFLKKDGNMDKILGGETLLHGGLHPIRKGEIDVFNQVKYPEFKVSNKLEVPIDVVDGVITINPTFSRADFEQYLGVKYIESDGQFLLRMLWMMEGVENINDKFEEIGRPTTIIFAETEKAKNYFVYSKTAQFTNWKSASQTEREPTWLGQDIRLQMMLEKLSKNYGINFNLVTNEDLDTPEWKAKIKNPTIRKAFIYNGEYYLNMDNMSLDSPVHEITHMLMGSIKALYPDLYYTMVDSVEELPDYNKLLKQYPNRARSDANEEIFVSKFAIQFASYIGDKTQMNRFGPSDSIFNLLEK